MVTQQLGCKSSRFACHLVNVDLQIFVPMDLFFGEKKLCMYVWMLIGKYSWIFMTLIH